MAISSKLKRLQCDILAGQDAAIRAIAEESDVALAKVVRKLLARALANAPTN